MEDTMIHRSLPYDPTPEDRLTHAKWARGFAIIYGSALLLLVAFLAAQRMFAEPTPTTGVANVSATQVGELAQGKALASRTGPRAP
jgi:hypothetical protein